MDQFLKVLTLGQIKDEIEKLSDKDSSGFINNYMNLFGKTKNRFIITPLIINNFEESKFYGRIVIFNEENGDIITKSDYFECGNILYLIIFLLNIEGISKFINKETLNGLGFFLSHYQIITTERVRIINEEIFKQIKNFIQI